MKDKLTSRKFWALVAGVLIPILNAVAGQPLDTASLVSAIAACIGYMYAESQTDKARAANGKPVAIDELIGKVFQHIANSGLELKQKRQSPRKSKQPETKADETKPQSDGLGYGDSE